MKEIDGGHEYLLDNLKDGGQTKFRFYKDKEIHGTGWKGPSTQEVIRMCAARVKSLEQEDPSPENEHILYHLRMVIIWFETRALRKAAQKGKPIENIATYYEGHIFSGDFG